MPVRDESLGEGAGDPLARSLERARRGVGVGDAAAAGTRRAPAGCESRAPLVRSFARVATLASSYRRRSYAIVLQAWSRPGPDG